MKLAIKQKVWNKGLTKETDERIRTQIKNLKKTVNSKKWKETKGKIKSKKISKTRKGYKQTKETIEKRRLALIGKTYEDIYGIEEAKIQKKKRSVSHIGKKHTLIHKKNNSKAHITNGITLYRKLAYKKYGYICSNCGIKDKRALMVHHKDKNRQNNKIENLIVLCYNCHVIEHINDFKRGRKKKCV